MAAPARLYQNEDFVGRLRVDYLAYIERQRQDVPWPGVKRIEKTNMNDLKAILMDPANGYHTTAPIPSFDYLGQPLIDFSDTNAVPPPGPYDNGDLAQERQHSVVSSRSEDEAAQTQLQVLNVYITISVRNESSIEKLHQAIELPLYTDYGPDIPYVLPYDVVAALVATGIADKVPATFMTQSRLHPEFKTRIFTTDGCGTLTMVPGCPGTLLVSKSLELAIDVKLDPPSTTLMHTSSDVAATASPPISDVLMAVSLEHEHESTPVDFDSWIQQKVQAMTGYTVFMEHKNKRLDNCTVVADWNFVSAVQTALLGSGPILGRRVTKKDISSILHIGETSRLAAVEASTLVRRLRSSRKDTDKQIVRLLESKEISGASQLLQMLREQSKLE